MEDFTNIFNLRITPHPMALQQMESLTDLVVVILAVVMPEKVTATQAAAAMIREAVIQAFHNPLFPNHTAANTLSNRDVFESY